MTLSRFVRCLALSLFEIQYHFVTVNANVLPHQTHYAAVGKLTEKERTVYGIAVTKPFAEKLKKREQLLE